CKPAATGAVIGDGHVADAVANHWHGLIDETGADQVAGFTWAGRSAVRLDDLDDAVVGIDVVGTALALRDAGSHLGAAVLIVDPALEGLLDGLSLVLEQGFRGSDDGLGANSPVLSAGQDMLGELVDGRRVGVDVERLVAGDAPQVRGRG